MKLRTHLSVATLALALAVPAPVAAAVQDARPVDTTIELPTPPTMNPEGIAVHGDTFFVSSVGTGAILFGNVHADTARVFLEPGRNGRTAAIGINVDAQGRLWIAGGPTGLVFVYDIATRRLLHRYDTGSGGFLNDLAFDSQGRAYVTDSIRPVLWRIGEDGLTPWLDLTRGPIRYVEGFNLNGIEASADGRQLLVVQSNTGNIFRISVGSKAVKRVDLGRRWLLGGDGMLLEGQTLWVVQGLYSTVTKVALSADLGTGRVTDRLGHPTFDTPTTIERAGRRFLVVNSQFARGGSPVLPFTVSRVLLRG